MRVRFPLDAPQQSVLFVYPNIAYTTLASTSIGVVFSDTLIISTENAHRIAPTHHPHNYRPNQWNALYGLLIPLESNSGHKSIQKHTTCDHGNCIARGLHNGEFWSSGKRVLGGHGWGGVLRRIFPIKNTRKLFVDSLPTLWYTRAPASHICIMCAISKRAFTLWPFRQPEKKIEKSSNTPLRINAAFGRLVAFPRKREHRSLAIELTAYSMGLR